MELWIFAFFLLCFSKVTKQGGLYEFDKISDFMSVLNQRREIYSAVFCIKLLLPFPEM